MDSYVVKTENFEGPLDLLLDFIEKRKLHINDISLSQVTDDYINQVKKLQEFSIPGIANFILVASTLLLIKSRSLLPHLSLSEEEEADISDLEERLKIYKRVRELSVHIKSRFGKEIIFERGEQKNEPIFSPPDMVTIPSLLASVKVVIKNIPIKEITPRAVVKKIISLEEMIVRLVERVEGSLKLSFREFSKGSVEKVEIIVSFLAMLELVKQGSIDVAQEKMFADIEMESQGVGVPRYLGRG